MTSSAKQLFDMVRSVLEEIEGQSSTLPQTKKGVQIPNGEQEPKIINAL